MKQTAVEWLAKQLEEYGDPEYCKIDWATLDELVEQAKKMESQQHLAIYNEGLKKSEGMMNFLYTEVEGRVDAFHNGRHKD